MNLIDHLIKLKPDIKGLKKISVVLPALNEADTVGDVIRSIKPLLGSLIDEIVVADSGSTDETCNIAKSLGAKVFYQNDIFSDVEIRSGKGEVMWRVSNYLETDLIVFMDADLINPDPLFVPKLIEPFFENPRIEMVKGYYRRPFSNENEDGGRATELAARPLLSALFPELSCIIQPLGGEYAMKSETLKNLSFSAQYGVDVGLLIDIYEKFGLDSISQTHLGVRDHRHQNLQQIGIMCRQIVATILNKAGYKDSGQPLIQYNITDDDVQIRNQVPLFSDRKDGVSMKKRINL